MWGYAIMVLGILAVGIIWFFANTTRTDQNNYNLLKETTEAAMLDAVDLAVYRQSGTVTIDEEKFVESFVRRFAENADLSNEYYEIEIYDISTTPPKVSLKVSSAQETSATGEIIEFDIVNHIDAILETKYKYEENVEEEEPEEEQIDFRERVDSQNLYGCLYDTTIYKIFKEGENQHYEFDVVPEEGCTAEINSFQIRYKSNYGKFSGKGYRMSCIPTNAYNTISCSFDCYEEYCEVQILYRVEWGL